MEISHGSTVCFKQRVALALALALALTTFVTPASAQRNKSRPKTQTFTEQGEILSPGLAQLTWVEFSLTCPDPPVSQGVTGYVIELPPAFTLGNATATVTGSADVSVLGGFRMTIWSANCDSLVNYEEPPQVVPSGGVFVMVEAPYDGAVSFELSVTAPVPRS